MLKSYLLKMETPLKISPERSWRWVSVRGSPSMIRTLRLPCKHQDEFMPFRNTSPPWCLWIWHEDGPTFMGDDAWNGKLSGKLWIDIYYTNHILQIEALEMDQQDSSSVSFHVFNKIILKSTTVSLLKSSWDVVLARMLSSTVSEMG